MELNVINSLLIIALCFSTIDAENTPVSHCHCLKVSNTIEKIPLQGLQNYTVQHQPPCLIKAIRFRRVQGTFICADPGSHRTKEAMEHLNLKKKKKKPPNPQPHNQGPSSSTEQTTYSAEQVYGTIPCNPFTTPTVQHRGPTASTMIPCSTPSTPTATSPFTEQEMGSTSTQPTQPPTTIPPRTQTQSTTTTQPTPSTTMSSIEDTNPVTRSSREVTNPVTRSSATDVTESTSSKPARPTHQKNLTTATVKHHDALATVTKAPANDTMATSSPTVMRQSTASTTRFKMAPWLARRRNRGKKSGLRKKQRAKWSYHRG